MIYLRKLIKNVYFCNSLTTVLINRFMINRVLIRLKIIQIVYAYYQNGSKNLDSAEKELFFSLSKAYDLYNVRLPKSFADIIERNRQNRQRQPDPKA